MNDHDPRTHYFDCECSSPEHTLRFVFDTVSLWDEAEKPQIYTEIYLDQYRNVFKRIWIAIKYIFGYKCRYGHWDCWCLNEKDAYRLKELCEEYIIKHNAWVDTYVPKKEATDERK